MAAPDIMTRFGASVRNLRFSLGLSQEALAKRADLHRTYIAGIESGTRNVTLKSIDKLVQALGISVSSLFPPNERVNGKAHSANRNGIGRNVIEILLVEDNTDDVELTLSTFKKARFTNRVHVVRNGADALEYLFGMGNHPDRRGEEYPQLVMLDLGLPKVSGLEVLRRIRSEKSTCNMPVVILTASKNDQDIDECNRLGVEVCIAKPVDFQNLVQTTALLELDWALLKPAKTKSRRTSA